MKFTSILKNVILENQTRFEVLLDNLTKSRKNKDGEKIKPILSKEEFFNYYSVISATISDDSYFDLSQSSRLAIMN